MPGPQTVRVRSGGEGMEASPGKAGCWVFGQQFFSGTNLWTQNGPLCWGDLPVERCRVVGGVRKADRAVGQPGRCKGLPLGVRGQRAGSQHHHPPPCHLGEVCTLSQLLIWRTVLRTKPSLWGSWGIRWNHLNKALSWVLASPECSVGNSVYIQGPCSGTLLDSAQRKWENRAQSPAPGNLGGVVSGEDTCFHEEPPKSPGEMRSSWLVLSLVSSLIFQAYLGGNIHSLANFFQPVVKTPCARRNGGERCLCLAADSAFRALLNSCEGKGPPSKLFLNLILY